MVPSARNVEITARPCSFAPSWAASSRVVMCLPFVPCLRLKGSSFWLTIRKGHDLIAVLTTGSLRSYCPVSDRLPRTASRTPAFLEYAYMALGDEFLTVWGYLSQVGSHRLLIRPARHAATRAVLAAPRPWLARTRSGTGR